MHNLGRYKNKQNNISKFQLASWLRWSGNNNTTPSGVGSSTAEHCTSRHGTTEGRHGGWEQKRRVRMGINEMVTATLYKGRAETKQNFEFILLNASNVRGLPPWMQLWVRDSFHTQDLEIINLWYAETPTWQHVLRWKWWGSSQAFVNFHFTFLCPWGSEAKHEVLSVKVSWRGSVTSSICTRPNMSVNCTSPQIRCWLLELCLMCSWAS